MRQQEKDELLKLIDQEKTKKWEKNMWRTVIEAEVPVVVIESI